MKLKIIVALLCCAVILMLSCNKETGLPNGNFPDLSSFMQAKKPQSQFFTMNAESGGTITGEQGTVITFPANLFVHADGSAVSGMVQVTLQEIFTTSDIIFSGVFPVSYGSSLNSGGEFFIGITQEGEELFPAEDMFMQVIIPAQAVDPEMQLFSGIQKDDTVQWIEFLPADSSEITSSFTFNSADSTYIISLDSTEWCNVDAYTAISDYTCTFHLTGAEGLSTENTTAYAVFDEKNSVWPLGVDFWGTITDNVITDTHLGGVDMHILVISVIDGNLYSGILAVDPEDGGSYTIPMHITTEAELDAAIAALP